MGENLNGNFEVILQELAKHEVKDEETPDEAGDKRENNNKLHVIECTA